MNHPIHAPPRPRRCVLLFLLAGCGGGLAADQACAHSSAASCAKLDACRANGVALRYGDMTTCIARSKANCLVSLQAQDTGRTPATQEACAVAYAAASCTDFIENTIPPCQPPLGARPLGRQCAYSSQCQSGFCAIAPGAACGTCAGVPTIGQSCAVTQCRNGQVCTDDTSTCQAYAAAGAACSTSSECQVGLGCVIAVAGMTGVCQPGGASPGTACDRKTGPICDYLKGQYCSTPPTTTAGACASYLQASAGQACGFTAGGGTSGSSFTVCTGGSSCIVPEGMDAGTCVAYATEGQPCDAALGPACLVPARCVINDGAPNGTCQLLSPGNCT